MSEDIEIGLRGKKVGVVTIGKRNCNVQFPSFYRRGSVKPRAEHWIPVALADQRGPNQLIIQNKKDS